METTPGLIDKLVKFQRENRYTDNDMAKFIGVSRQLYSRYRAKEHLALSAISPFISGVRKAFPKLKRDVDAFILKAGNSNGKQ